MADRPQGGPRKGTPEYDWLYGKKGQQPAGDETRVMPAAGHAGGGGTPPADPPPSRRPVPPSKPAKRRSFRWGRAVIALVLAWVLFLVLVPLFAWSKVDKVNAFPNGDRPGDQPGTTYLMVGSDSRGDLSAEERKALGTGDASGQRTDTIMLLHTGSGPNLLMSIPRDSLVDIPGYGNTKINAAYAYDGPKLLVRTVENETGIRIDHFVEVGFGGFVDLVDAVGGVEICPKQAIQDPQAKLNVKKGCQEADGPTALGYARSRKAFENGDLDRAANQREVVSAIGREAVSPWSVLNPFRYWALNMAGARAVRVSEGSSPFAMARWAIAMTRVNGENGLTCGVPIADFAVNWDDERSEQMFEYIRSDDTGSIPKRLCTPTGFAR